MRTVSVRNGSIALALVLALSACNEGSAANTTTIPSGSASSTTTAETRLVTVSTGPSTVPQETVPAELVEDCLVYVEYYAGQGDPYMSMLWNSAAGDLEKVRAACAEQWYKTDDVNADGVLDGRAELARMSAQAQALADFFASFYTTTTAATSTGSTVAPSTTHPGATPVCPPNQVLTTDGFCVAG
jgi:hypothetical protein